MLTMKPLKSVPTHVVTGFLGSGKSQLIRHWIEQKPEHERWTILVNEFGQVGVDQALLGKTPGVHVQAVPGGCLCCQVATVFRSVLVQTLRRERPDRLLIEPSGLGHPAGLLEVLSSGDLADALTLQAVVAVLDPRRVADARVVAHDTFKQQLSVADAWVLSMTDLVRSDDHAVFERWRECQSQVPGVVIQSDHHGLPLSWLLDLAPRTALAGARGGARPAEHALVASLPSEDVEPVLPLAGPGTRREGQGLGYRSVSWCWHPDESFEEQGLHDWWQGLPSPCRGKGVMRTLAGWLVLPAGEQRERWGQWQQDSRLELIWPVDMPMDIDALSSALEACRVTK